MLLSHLTQIDDGITHAPQGRIDTYIRGVSYLFERQLLIESHVHHFTLSGGQKVHHPLDIAENLVVNELALNVLVLHFLTTKV